MAIAWLSCLNRSSGKTAIGTFDFATSWSGPHLRRVGASLSCSCVWWTTESDDARNRLASNGTFWTMIHGLDDNQPVWMAQLASHWLRRRFKISRTLDEDPLTRRDLLHDDFGTQPILQAAERAPREFVQHVLPAMLEIIEATAYKVEYPPAGDPIWSFRMLSEHLSLSDAYSNGVRDGFIHIVANEPVAARLYMDQLKGSPTDTGQLHFAFSATRWRSGLR